MGGDVDLGPVHVDRLGYAGLAQGLAHAMLQAGHFLVRVELAVGTIPAVVVNGHKQHAPQPLARAVEVGHFQAIGLVQLPEFTGGLPFKPAVGPAGTWWPAAETSGRQVAMDGSSFERARGYREGRVNFRQPDQLGDGASRHFLLELCQPGQHRLAQDPGLPLVFSGAGLQARKAQRPELAVPCLEGGHREPPGLTGRRLPLLGGQPVQDAPAFPAQERTPQQFADAAVAVKSPLQPAFLVHGLPLPP